MKRHTSHTKHDVLTSLRVLFLHILPADLLKMSHYKLCFNLFIEDLTADLLSSLLPGFQKQCNCPNRSKTMTYLFFFRREFYMHLENPNSVLICRALGLKVGLSNVTNIQNYGEMLHLQAQKCLPQKQV